MTIYVETEEEKQSIIDQSRYIHDFGKVIRYRAKHGGKKKKVIGLNSNKAGTLMHLYMNPDMIVVTRLLVDRIDDGSLKTNT